ncbi:MAG: chromosomal replication initiator protein DnaA [Gemmatimonadota bacterium]|nr:MAG: chromosomal replication initiator protein DnaA [Gemmatimonadota bacterium]
MELTAAEVWTRVLSAARASLPEQSYRTWLAGSSAIALTDEELLVECASEFHVEWIEDKYGVMLSGLAGRLLGRDLRLSFRPADPEAISSVPAVEVAHPTPQTTGAPPLPRERPSGLNERYTFERFVVGNNNQLASAACHAVALQPARMYNPLFLYGGVGLGKTHLMHAIANAILGERPETRVSYVPSERFTNELVTSIQAGTTPDFRRRYRQMDLLLVDDIHFLEGKERTQEEFFHTFNALYDAHKQIILTSDRPPKEIPGLEERLVSRFEWGLVADMKPPDYETRVAILRKKAEDDSLSLDPDVIDFIARSCTNSVRELEGAVIKLLAYSSLTNQEITVDLAHTSLLSSGGVLGGGSEPLGPERVRETVASRWNVSSDGLSSKRRTKDLTVPRQVAMYLIKDLLDLPLVQIGNLFGGRDHSTVIHSIRKVEDAMAKDPDFRREVESIREELRRPV